MCPGARGEGFRRRTGESAVSLRWVKGRKDKLRWVENRKGQSGFKCAEKIITPPQNLLILKLSLKKATILVLCCGLSTLGLKSVGHVRGPSHLVLLFSQELLDNTVLSDYLVSEEIGSGLFGYLPSVI